MFIIIKKNINNKVNLTSILFSYRYKPFIKNFQIFQIKKGIFNIMLLIILSMIYVLKASNKSVSIKENLLLSRAPSIFSIIIGFEITYSIS